jgi:hypothetical protein
MPKSIAKAPRINTPLGEKFKSIKRIKYGTFRSKLAVSKDSGA